MVINGSGAEKASVGLLQLFDVSTDLEAETENRLGVERMV